MEKLSRVKKYEQLRKEIETEPAEEIKSDQLSQYENRLNEFDPVLFKKMEVKEEVHVPVREKKETLADTSTDLFNTDSFKNEYMDDIIRDVKEYNLKRGLMESDNTQIDILHQLNRPAVRRREDYIKELNDDPISQPQPVVESETASQSKQEIAKQIQELLHESETLPVQGMSVKRVEIEKQETTPAMIQQDATHEYTMMNRMNEDFQRKITEETQQIRVQLDEYEEEITGLNKGINKTHKLLNMIMLLLVLAFVIIVGISVFWVLQSMGKI